MPVEGKFIECPLCQERGRHEPQIVLCLSCEQNKAAIERLNKYLKPFDSISAEVGRLNNILEKTSKWLNQHNLQDVVKAYRDESRQHQRLS